MQDLECFKAKVGRLGIECSGFTVPEMNRFGKFIRRVDESSGDLFDRNASINLSIRGEEKNGEAKCLFANGSDIEYNGLNRPSGWQLRRTHGKDFVFYSPKDGDYLLVEGNSNPKDVHVTIYEQRRTYRVLHLCGEDLLQLGTSGSIIWSTALNIGNVGVLLVSESKGGGFRGKTTLLAQLISAKCDIAVTSEDRTLVGNGSASCITTNGLLRKGAQQYLGLPGTSVLYIDFADYTKFLPRLESISLILVPIINFDGIYDMDGPKPIPSSVVPMERDWFCQTFSKEDVFELVRAKERSLKSALPKTTTTLQYSTDASKTAGLINSLLAKRATL